MKKQGPTQQRPMSREEQRKEAEHDTTGKIRKYLDLAEKLFGISEEEEAPASAPLDYWLRMNF